MKKIKVLAIDIGHNVNYDTGAVGIRKEDELNRLVGEALIGKCRAVGVSVVNCTPGSASSQYDSLNKRVVAANNANADFFISIHHNACPGGYGTEILCIKGGQQNALSERASNVILAEVCTLGLRNRGVKDRRDLYVLNKTTMPAILIECAFVDSSSDMSGYSTEKMAEVVFKGICKAFGISSGGIVGEGSGGDIHTVVSGDTLWGISRKYGVSVERLVEVNGIGNRDVIGIGQKIRVR